MASYYSARFTTSDEKIVLTFLEKYSYKYLYSREKGDKTDKVHFHLYFETMSKSPAIRMWIRKNIGTGNGNYTMKAVEENPVEYLSYVIKDGDYKFSDNYDLKEIELIRNYDEKVKMEIQEKKEKKKNKKSHIVKYVEQNLHFRHRLPDHLKGPRPSFETLRREVLLLLIRYVREEDLYPSVNRLRSESLYVIQKIFGDSYDRDILDLCM